MRYTSYSSIFLEKEQLASLSNNRLASELLPMGTWGKPRSSRSGTRPTNLIGQAMTTTPATPAKRAPRTKPKPTLEQAEKASTAANVALLEASERELADRQKAVTAAQKAEKAALVAARTSADQASEANNKAAALQLRLNGTPAPAPAPVVTPVVAPAPAPVAAPAAPVNVVVNPPYNPNPRSWSLLQWVFGVVGLVIGLIAARLTMGFPLWIVPNPAEWLKTVFIIVWYIAWVGVLFCIGGLIGFRVENRRPRP